jgi:hypothetical protein
MRPPPVTERDRLRRHLFESAARAVSQSLAALALAIAAPVAAEPGPAAQAEIDRLLQFVAASPCTFVRNGTPHPAADARRHLEDKLRHARSRISTAEDFIRGVATQSSVSGRPYLIRCEGRDVSAGAWLSAELQRLRATERQGGARSTP